jgi:hypothetical protein
MTLASGLKGLAYNVRGIAGALGVRPHTVSILKRSWSGSQPGDGTQTDVEMTIHEGGNFPPKVRWLTEEQLAVGNLGAGSVAIGPITPSFRGGGTDLSFLDGSLLEAKEARYLRITGPMHPQGAVYRIVKLTADHALHYTITASPVSNQ